jgi:hypothetical protein
MTQFRTTHPVAERADLAQMPLRREATGRDYQQRDRPARHLQLPCIERGVAIAYNAEVTDAARKDVVEFLSNLFNK